MKVLKRDVFQQAINMFTSQMIKHVEIVSSVSMTPVRPVLLQEYEMKAGIEEAFIRLKNIYEQNGFIVVDSMQEYLQ